MTPQFPAKPALRARMRDMRRNIPDHERARLNELLAGHVLELVTRSQPCTVALFWPFDGEPDLTGLLPRLANLGYQLALPVIDTDVTPGMQFHRWTPDCAMQPGSFHIPQPANTALVPIEAIDILLMPLLAWDRSGNRLGMGAGYYDRYLADRADESVPRRIGVAWSSQEVTELLAEDWDIRMHAMLTENGCLPVATERPE